MISIGVYVVFFSYKSYDYYHCLHFIENGTDGNGNAVDCNCTVIMNSKVG